MVKPDTVAKVLGLGTGSVTSLAQETSRTCLLEKCLLFFKDMGFIHNSESLKLFSKSGGIQQLDTLIAG